MSLVERFKEYVVQHRLFTHDDRVLLAVSGGVDSMVLMRLMQDAGFSFGVAHCNFQLRGAESDGDELLVEQEVARLGVEYHVTHFDTEGVMDDTGESMEMAARRLRYAWFDELCVAHGFKVVAVAHHVDDSIETHFINMLRGTGLRGLTGIAVHNNRVVRPLMFATREEILTYACTCGVPFREDSSNRSTKYLRNRVRHEVVPKLKEINGQYINVMSRNLSRLDEAQRFIDASVANIKRKVLTKGDNDYVLSVAEIDVALPRNFVIYEILNSEFGFNGDVVDDICGVLDCGASGRRFYAADWMAVVDRGNIIIAAKANDVEQDALELCVGVDVATIELGDHVMSFEYLDIERITTLNQGADVALLDADRLSYPLHIRVWRDGDSFVPLGMRGHKKVSDYLVDSKVSVVAKRGQRVLLSGNDIAWLVGRRVDNRYAITQNTKRVLRVSMD